MPQSVCGVLVKRGWVGYISPFTTPMAQTDTQAFFTMIGEAARILVVLPKEHGIDHLAAAAVLTDVLVHKNKTVRVYADGFSEKIQPKFLGPFDTFTPHIPQLASLVIRIPTTAVSLKELSYQRTQNALEVSIAPLSGAWNPNDIQLEMRDVLFDLIIVLGGSEVAALGALGKEHADLFSRLPVINIDVNAHNERFGTLNIIDTTKSALTQLLYTLLHEAKEIISARQATLLLSGIIARSNRFTIERLSPDALTVASDLVALGAERQMILHDLYRTRSVPTLRLWGRALARLKTDPAHSMVWSVLTRQDFALAGTAEGQLGDALNELIAATPDANIACLIAETETDVVCHIATKSGLHATRLLAELRAQGDAVQATAHLTQKTLPEAEAQILKIIRQSLNSTPAL